MLVSIVILAYNSERYLSVCLDEVSRTQGLDFEIIVVDNASRDRSVEIARAHPAAPKVIETGRNAGCAGGNNIGWRAATGEIVVFVNPDCAPDPGSIARLVQPLVEDESIGLTGSLLYYPNSRTIQHAGGILYPNAMCEHLGYGKPDAPEFHEDRDVPYVTGTLFALRRGDLESLGGFDEDYFPAYYEETDLCWRVRASGLRVRFVAESIGWHWESVELGRRSRGLVRMSYHSRMVYCVKNVVFSRDVWGALVFELRWFVAPHARGFRWLTVESWLHGAFFAARCVLRGRLRPRGIRSRLPRSR